MATGAYQLINWGRNKQKTERSMSFHADEGLKRNNVTSTDIIKEPDNKFGVYQFSQHSTRIMHRLKRYD